MKLYIYIKMKGGTGNRDKGQNGNFTGERKNSV